jgi:uncharacterized membrane protein YphA (DoxX/SURF4 family)
MGFIRSRLFRFIASIGLAALFYFLCPPCFNKMYLLGVLLLLVLIINLGQYIGRVSILTQIVRVAVGGLFIFSGFIKANDPVGFSIKLNEYFEVFDQGFSCDMQVANPNGNTIPCEIEVVAREQKAKEEAAINGAAAGNGSVIAPPQKTGFMHSVWEWFGEHSVFLAIVITGFEMALGFFLLLGLQVRWTLLLLLAMIVFFSFLTFYSACCNKVTSCGCFGDAIKLTPWESFWKDLILLILISILFVGEHNIKPLFKNQIVLAGVAGILLFASFAFPVYTYRHLPVIDFRPYKIGTNLYEASHPKDPGTTGCQNDSMIITYYYKQQGTGKIIHFRSTSLDSFPDSTFDYYCRHDFLVRKGNCAATVLDFNLVDPETGNSLNDSLLRLKGVQFFLVMEDLDKTDHDAMGRINLLYAECEKKHIPFNGLSNGDPEHVNNFRVQTGAKFPMLQVDGTALKTMIRSNPGLMMLRDGVVVGMWHANDIPTLENALH